MSKFKIGDRVQKNSFNIRDSNKILEGWAGKIIQMQTDINHRYLVKWDSVEGLPSLNWWIAEACLESETTLSKENRILAKIKYLDKRFSERKHATDF